MTKNTTSYKDSDDEIPAAYIFVPGCEEEGEAQKKYRRGRGWNWKKLIQDFGLARVLEGLAEADDYIDEQNWRTNFENWLVNNQWASEYDHVKKPSPVKRCWDWDQQKDIENYKALVARADSKAQFIIFVKVKVGEHIWNDVYGWDAKDNAEIAAEIFDTSHWK